MTNREWLESLSDEEFANWLEMSYGLFDAIERGALDWLREKYGGDDADN